MKMRAAIAGAGLMGFWHAQNIVRAGGEVAAVCDVDERSARRLASRFKGARARTRLEETWEQDKIGVLHVCTPLSTHFELAAAALSRGINVLIEKPMTRDCAEAERLYALAAEHRVLLCPVHQFAFQSGVQRALTMSGRIGQLRHFEATFCSAGGVGKSEEQLDTIVAEILPHPLSLMQLFAPGSLREQGWVVSRLAPGEFRATLVTQDASFSILISLNSRPTVAALRLFGTGGTIHLDLFHGFSVLEPGAVSRWRKILHPLDLSARTIFAAGSNLMSRAWGWEPAYPGLRPLIERFYEAIFAGLEPPVRRKDAIEIAALRDKLSERGLAVSLSSPPL